MDTWVWLLEYELHCRVIRLRTFTGDHLVSALLVLSSWADQVLHKRLFWTPAGKIWPGSALAARERGWSVFSMQYPHNTSIFCVLLCPWLCMTFSYSCTVSFILPRRKTFPDQLSWRRGSCPEVCNGSEDLFVRLFIRIYYMPGVRYIYFTNLSLQRGKKCQYPIFQMQELKQRVVQ